jgi:hypothetical protein
MAATTLAQIGMGMSLTVTFACDTTRNTWAIDMSIRKAAAIAVAGFMGSASISVHSRFEQLYKRGGCLSLFVIFCKNVKAQFLAALFRDGMRA